MDNVEPPIQVIQNWQEWYRKNKVVAEMDQPLVSKTSRENLHNTSSAAKTLDEAFCKATLKTQAFNEFSDILATYMNTLGAKEVYKIFFEAAQEYKENLEIEYKQASNLLDRLRYRTQG